MTDTQLGSLIGEISSLNQPVDPAKVRFVEAVAGSIKSGPVDFCTDLSGYGEEGWVSGSAELGWDDAYVTALGAWYDYCGVAMPPLHLLHQEAGNWAKLTRGYAAAGPDTGVIADLKFLREDLERAWSEETAADAAWWRRNQPSRPSVGQCAVTALVVHERFGGDLLRVIVPEGATRILGFSKNVNSPEQSHYFNRLPDGRVVDLTRDQFDSWEPMGPPVVRERDYLMSHPDTVTRYRILRANLFDPVVDED